MELSTAYDVLGLKLESNVEEARKVFDALVIRWHPDRVKAPTRQQHHHPRWGQHS